MEPLQLGWLEVPAGASMVLPRGMSFGWRDENGATSIRAAPRHRFDEDEALAASACMAHPAPRGDQASEAVYQRSLGLPGGGTVELCRFEPLLTISQARRLLRRELGGCGALRAELVNAGFVDDSSGPDKSNELDGDVWRCSVAHPEES